MSRGFTLVELMITIAVAALLALAAMPFTADWVDTARQMQARNLLREGAGHARALALRNPDARPGDEAVARLDLDADGRLQVLQLRPSPTADVVVWQGQVHPSLSFKDDGNATFACIAYTSRGAWAPDESDCVARPTVSVVGRSVEEALDVGLL